MVAMSVSTARVIARDSSALNLSCIMAAAHGSLFTCSDDIIDAAWDSGLGVHALIWVFYSSILLTDINSSTHRTSLVSTVTVFGKLAETLFLQLYTRTPKPNLSLVLFNSAPSPSTTVF
jgi:hypothetical protein